MAFHIATGLDLPESAVSETFAMLGRRGSGKTNCAVVMAEEMLKGGHIIHWVDPVGVAWGLRSDFKILIAGGEKGDIPLEPGNGALMAEFLVDNPVPCILDISSFGENEMRRFVGEFGAKFYLLKNPQEKRTPVHLFFDEADEYAPQDGTRGAAAQSLSAMQNLIRRGRSRGIGATLITQRSAVINKSVLTQTEVLCAFQTTAPHDLRAIGDWIKYHGTAEECAQILSELPKLQQGEAWVYSPGWLKILKRVKIRARRTFDSSRTPGAGEQRTAPKTLAQVDLKALTGKLAESIKRAKENDPAELKRQIAELKKKISINDSAVDQSAIETAVAARDKHWQSQLATMQQAIDLRDGRLGQIEKLARLNGDAKIALAPLPAVQKTARPIVQPNPRQIEQREDSGALPKGEAAIVRAAIQYPNGLERNQLTVLTGYKRSSRDAYIARAKDRGLVVETGGRIAATPEGIAAIPDAEPLPTGVELQELWRQRLPEGERRILDVLISQHPNDVERDQLDAATGYKRSSRDAYIARLAAKELVVQGRGTVRASDVLFQE